MRTAIIVCAAALVGSAALACYQTTSPPPSSTTTLTSADPTDPSNEFQDPWSKRDAGAHPYDSDYDNADRVGKSPGVAPPGVGIRGAPMGRPQPWRGAGGGGSR